MSVFDGITLRGADPGHTVRDELLALDLRYVWCDDVSDDHLRFLIKQGRIPVVAGSPGAAPEPSRWMTAVLYSAKAERAIDPAVPDACTLLIRTDVLTPSAAAKALHALAMA